MITEDRGMSREVDPKLREGRRPANRDLKQKNILEKGGGEKGSGPGA